jgi:PAS domain S-box-containing protein
LGLALGAVFWVVDSLVDGLVFRNRSFVDEALKPHGVELWMRLFVLGLLLGFSVFAGFIIAQRRRAEANLRMAQDQLEERVRERTVALEETNVALQNEIAGRRQAQESLTKHEEWLLRLLETTNVIPWEADAQTWQFTYVGPQAVALLGYPLDQWYEKDFWVAHLHDDDRQQAIDFCDKSSRSCSAYDFEYRMMAADGRVVWLHDIVNVEVESGVPKVLRGFMLDITMRRQAAQKLERSEQRFRRLLEAAPDAIVLIRPDGTIALVNEQVEQLFGYRREELADQSVEMLMPQRFRSRHTASLLKFHNQPRSGLLGDRLELHGLHKDGQEFPVEIILSPLDTDEGLLVCGSIRDVSERKRAKEAIAESAEQVRLMADALPVFISYADVEQRYRFANHAFEEWLGVSREEIRGRTVKDVIGEESYEAIQSHVEEALAGRDVSYERDVLRRGVRHRLRVSLVPHRDRDGNVIGVYALASDVTAQVNAEEESRRHREELARVSRVATVGELTASLAHELNQPLSAIISNAQASRRFLAGEEPDVQELRDALHDIIEDGKRAADVIRGLRALLQKGDIERRVLDLNEIIREVAALMHGELVAKSIRLELDLESALPPVVGDRIQLQQVFLNLILNGSDAMKDVAAAHRELVIKTAIDGADTVEIAVRDAGQGLDPDNADRLFEPFHTTKPDGLGMGLSINRSIVDAHGGRLWATQNPDQPIGAAESRARLHPTSMRIGLRSNSGPPPPSRRFTNCRRPRSCPTRSRRRHLEPSDGPWPQGRLSTTSNRRNARRAQTRCQRYRQLHHPCAPHGMEGIRLWKAGWRRLSTISLVRRPPLESPASPCPSPPSINSCPVNHD